MACARAKSAWPSSFVICRNRARWTTASTTGSPLIPSTTQICTSGVAVGLAVMVGVGVGVAVLTAVGVTAAAAVGVDGRGVSVGAAGGGLTAGTVAVGGLCRQLTAKNRSVTPSQRRQWASEVIIAYSPLVAVRPIRPAARPQPDLVGRPAQTNQRRDVAEAQQPVQNQLLALKQMPADHFIVILRAAASARTRHPHILPEPLRK